MIGGKLVGAGGGGFLLLYARNPADTRQAMAAAGATELPFDFEFVGAYVQRVHMSTRGLRVAIVGCGLIGDKRAAALGPEDEVRRCHRPGGRARGCSRGASTAVVPAPELDELLELQPDVVIVATTHDQLAPHGRAGARRGRPRARGEARGARDGADRAPDSGRASEPGGVVKVGFNHRFHPAICATLASEVHSGRHGELMHLRARYGHGGRLGYDREWRAQPERSGGGELIDQGMHLLDLTHWIAGPLPLHSALLRTHFWDTPVEDNAALILGEADDRARRPGRCCT